MLLSGTIRFGAFLKFCLKFRVVWLGNWIVFLVSSSSSFYKIQKLKKHFVVSFAFVLNFCFHFVTFFEALLRFLAFDFWLGLGREFSLVSFSCFEYILVSLYWEFLIWELALWIAGKVIELRDSWKFLFALLDFAS